jgi:single-strand DNA-binding protein
MNFNRAIIIGNLTRDPELKSLPSGIKVCSFSVATNRVWKDQDGQKKEAADYHNVVVFGRQAETVAQYMKKGSNILVEGRMQTRSWDDKNSGEKKYRTEIVADKTQFGPKLGGSSNFNNSNSGSNSNSANKNESQNQGQEDNSGSIDYPEDDINPEDIPF